MKYYGYLVAFLMLSSMSLAFAEHEHRAIVSDKDQSSSIVYNVYDSAINGVKGGLFAGIVTPLTLGTAALYFDLKLVDLCIKKMMLLASNAQQFGNKSRSQLEKETALRELSNRFSKAFVSTFLLALELVLLDRVLKK